MGWLGGKIKAGKKPGRQPRVSAGDDGYAFRRSRTITGTTSPKVTGSAENRSQLKTPRLVASELHQQKARIVRVLVFSVLAAGAVGLLLANYDRDIKASYVQPGLVIADDAARTYEDGVREYYREFPLQRLGFMLDADELEMFMKHRFSEIDAFRTVGMWYGGVERFDVEFRRPLMVWRTDGQRLYIDDEGVAFGVDYFGGGLVEVRDESGVSSDAGSSVASQRFIRFLGNLVGAVNRGGRGEVEAIVIPGSTRQIDLRLQGRGYPIKTHIDRDPLYQAEDVVNVLRYIDEKGIGPEYVDVRVGGKAFYR